MKKSSLAALFLGLILSLNSCGNSNQASPEAATRYFLEQLADVEFEKAATCATPEMQRHLRLLHTEWKMSNESERQLLKSSLQTTFSSVKCQETDGLTLCNICCNSKGDTARLELQQHDGQWFVHQ